MLITKLISTLKLPCFFKPRGTLDHLFEVTGPPMYCCTALTRPKLGRNSCLGTTTPFFDVYMYTSLVPQLTLTLPPKSCDFFFFQDKFHDLKYHSSTAMCTCTLVANMITSCTGCCSWNMVPHTFWSPSESQ